MVIVEANEDIPPLFASANEALVTQPAQLMRDSRLRQSETLYQISDTQFSL
jgi:hypothetical protein